MLMKPKSDHIQAAQASTTDGLYSSRILVSYLEFLQKEYPRLDLDGLCQTAGISRFAVEDAGHWFTQQDTDRFHAALRRLTGDPDIARRAGRYTVSATKLGAARQYALGMMNLAAVYLMVGKLANSMTRGATFKAHKLSKTRAEVTSRPNPGTHEKPYQCQNRIGILEGIPRLFNQPLATIDHPECLHKGGACCRYIISWEQSPSLAWKQASRIGITLGLAGLIAGGFFFGPLVWLSLVLGVVLANWGISHRASRLATRELQNTVRVQGNAAQELLEEVNNRHNNALMIQEIGQSIAGELDTDRIVAKVSEQMAKHSYFSMGQIYLVSEQGEALTQKAQFGLRDTEALPPAPPDIALADPNHTSIIKRCFEDQQVQFLTPDQSSGALSNRTPVPAQGIAAFGSGLCVPIVYRQDTLGVLVAQKDTVADALTQTDISLLMGIASQTAASIMNARSFRRIKESERRYRILADNVTDVIWTYDLLAERFSYVSPSVKRMQGYTPEEQLHMTLEALLTPESFNQATQVIAEELAHEEAPSADPFRARTIELEQYHKEGSILSIEVTASFLRDAEGKVTGILGVSRDISERKRAAKEKSNLEKQLQQAQKMEAIGTLAGGVAHDLNNILSGIVSYPELLLLKLPDDSPLRDPLTTIKTSGKKAAAIVQDLLTLARRGVATSEVINLNDIVQEYLASPEYAKLVSYHPDVNLQTTLSADLLNIAGSPVHLSKTVMNLVSNAAEAMPAGGELQITTENRYIDYPIKGYDRVEEGDYCVLTVKDNGVGISSEDQRRIFEPFYTKKIMGRSGTGLGMAVVWGTVKDHQGYIDLTSVIDQGTTVELYFPVTRKAKFSAAHSRSIEDLMGQGESILVVDDIREQREIATSILEQLGYRAHAVASGEEAVGYLRDTTVDLLILDMIMDPGMDGLTTFEQILQSHPEQQAIIASGFAETQRVKRAQELGASTYLKKPYTIERMGLSVRKALTKM
jgi:PAS domain S-box-containing protein